ncbi:sigma-54 dependent transcriptional regulator [Marinobacter sp. F3R11]|uniref:sigma-54 dependent transcriptional regulator n=1 Tax=Marinobacter sp. F3R11 TaxID=2267231 RepID=UPI000DE9047D|nr:sigma-54 dependent transcriptional regulator [Marinobacter sp. F3R11]RBW48995.1 sigma-54-dependent Fis family transcriptional regulator [Marinobacter sp. F3R11]
MVEKRPLVWLSAANSNTRIRKSMGTNWDLIDFSFDDTVPLYTLLPDKARVGVLELPALSPENISNLEGWVETLDLTYWIAIAPQRPISGTPATKLIARYCSDFHTLPVDYKRINTVLGHLWGMATILMPANNPGCHSYQNLALEGKSQSIRDVRNLLRRFAATQEPVLISGENGTGKEAAARFVHTNSARAHGPLVFVNCPALPSALTQSELFGYEKGAFTSAMSSRQGRLEQANGGSLVFSRIDELHLEQQSAILRFLQEGEIERVGGNARIRADGRIIAITSQQLPDLVALGRFRSDVYFRLGSLEVKLPPLKNRREDIPVIAGALLQTCWPEARQKRLSKDAIQSLVNHSWPGNLQELQNRLRQGVLLSDRAVIEAADLGLNLSGSTTNPLSNLSLKEFRARADRQALLCGLQSANYNMSEAARVLKISRVSLYRLLEKYNLNLHSHNPRRKPYRKGDLT